jgi:ABC-type oligopeptide transport system substrate-binding subunit
VADPTARLNLYNAGIGAVVAQPNIPTIILTLRRRKDFRPQRYYASEFIAINTTTPPLNDVRVRYALNMATDKLPIANLTGAGSVLAVGLAPPTEDYPAPRTLPVSSDGTTYDVLSFNPRAARELLAKATPRFPDRLEYFAPNLPDCTLWAQILREQWKAHLGLELVMVAVELTVWVQSVRAGNFRHVAQWGLEASYVDPVWFLDVFSSQGGYGTSWSDPVYKQMLSEARRTSDPTLRMARLAECERQLLQAMPIIPQAHDVNPKLTKPFVNGLGSNLLNREQLKYAWIDTGWRPQ